MRKDLRVTTPWELISDESFKSWLLLAMTIEEYNDKDSSPPRDLRNLLTDFEEWKQQNV